MPNVSATFKVMVVFIMVAFVAMVFIVQTHTMTSSLGRIEAQLAGASFTRVVCPTPEATPSATVTPSKKVTATPTDSPTPTP